MEHTKKGGAAKAVAAAIVLILIGASFYGGMLYGKANAPRGYNGQFAAGGIRMGGRGGAGGVTAGSIIAKDATSITVKMQDGSTKIVLTSGTTKVMKSTSGTLDDLSVGTNVVVTGSVNSDQSVTATSVQIRPVPTTPPATPGGQ